MLTLDSQWVMYYPFVFHYLPFGPIHPSLKIDEWVDCAQTHILMLPHFTHFGSCDAHIFVGPLMGSKHSDPKWTQSV